MSVTQLDKQACTPHYTFPADFEIIECILLYLNHQDIVQASGVCKYWKSCIQGSEPLMRKIHKLALRMSEHENPHFEDLTKESKKAIIPRRKLAGKNLWSTVREIEDSKIDGMHEKTREKLNDEKKKTEREGAEKENANNVSDAIKDLDEDQEEEKDFQQIYSYKMRDVRMGFKDIRYINSIPIGWPISLRELHCDVCDHWHTSFRFENLHPLFQFLEDMTMCFRGHGSQLMIKLSIVSEQMAPMSCWEHSCEEARRVAKYLRKVYEAVQAGGVA